eukprot:scaffold30763_cov76-Phaeocystis_antarctica.AAC.5
MTPLTSARRTDWERKRARNRRSSARKSATQPPSARRRRRAKTTSPLTSGPRGARGTRSRRPGATAPTARNIARRPAVFAPSRALHHLRHHHIHTRSRAAVGPRRMRLL